MEMTGELEEVAVWVRVRRAGSVHESVVRHTTRRQGTCRDATWVHVKRRTNAPASSAETGRRGVVWWAGAPRDGAGAAAAAVEYGDEKVANRDIRVWHTARQKTVLE
jgi:hypothetical protein